MADTALKQAATVSLPARVLNELIQVAEELLPMAATADYDEIAHRGHLAIEDVKFVIAKDRL